MRGYVSGSTMQDSTISTEDLSTPDARAVLVKLSGHGQPQIAEAAIILLAACWQSAEVVQAIDAPQLMAVLAQQLQRCVPAAGRSIGRAHASMASLHRAALRAMSALLLHAPNCAPAATACLPALAASVRWPCAETQLLACTAIANLLDTSHASLLTAAQKQPLQLPQLGNAEQGVDGNALLTGLRSLVLPTLIKLMGVEAFRRHVPAVLLRTIGKHRGLQGTLADSDVLQQLTSLVVHQVSAPH
jgi:hypothetical protein